MSENRFYAQNIQAGRFTLEGPEAHHMCGVMRLGVGSEVELFDGKGKVGRAVIVEPRKKKVILDIESVEIVSPRQTNRIILAVSLAKGQRFDWLISKATELGVDRVIPVLYERTVKQGKGGGLVERFVNLSISAAKQCERNILPAIDTPMPLGRAIQTIDSEYPGCTRLTGSLEEDAKPLTGIGQFASDYVAFIGPEGGMTGQEEEMLRQSGCEPVRLTKTILRIETAALAFASILTVARDSA